MSPLQPTDFAAFFQDIHGYTPFPWQKRLAQRVCDEGWPRCIALPTAAGKTACLDIAVFAMAYQAQWPVEKRTAPRRVFFVVDRRVVVDQAFEHAKDLAGKLGNAQTALTKQIADTLKELGGMDRPLDCYALRGGMYRESAWVRSPLQPTIITSTVDQVGSRLLFRGYGVSDSLKPLHAALVGNDALILLDEAHCSKPMAQTMELVQKYRTWTKESLSSPFHFVSLTATPAESVPDTDIERDREDDHADPVLGPRLQTSKPTTLIVATKATGKNWRPGLEDELIRQAQHLQIEIGYQAIGIMVNRVATARAVRKKLANKCQDKAEVVLLTGRMRPLDRKAVLQQLQPLVSGKSLGLIKPIFVVATQCLEVGADLDFHALVTECASLDALRQRLGRLNRIAAREKASAAIVIRADQVEPQDNETEADPIYGNSLARTWQWLKQHATDGVFDFGVNAVRAQTQGMTPDELAQLSAPAPDAAVLLPAHLDLWCQTAPIPMPDPDPAVFLHGPARGTPDVQVVFRQDLGDNPDLWAPIVTLCPPSSSEALPVRLDIFKQWLAGQTTEDDSSDVEGEITSTTTDPEAADRQALRWCGAESPSTGVVTSPHEIKPSGTYIVPINNRWDYTGLGDFLTSPPTDLAEEAYQVARDRALLRLHPSVFNCEPVKSLLLDSTEEDDLADNLSLAIESFTNDARPWMQRAIKSLAKPNRRLVQVHPAGGYVVLGKNRLNQFDPTFIEAEESDWTAAAEPIFLARHCDETAQYADGFAAQVGFPAGLCSALRLAGMLHDTGKADPRFQAWLHGGNRRRADLFPHRLAKAIEPMTTRAERDAARTLAGYPKGGRHELHSVRLVESNGLLPTDPDTRDLVLHLIASHHGYCRPFAPVVEDKTPAPFTYQCGEHDLTFTPNPACISGHGLERLDSGVAQRFWTLTRRYGWWGLPWLESMLRLADWATSDAAEKRSDDDPNT